MCAQSLSRVWLFAKLWTIACQATLSMGFSRQEYWGGLLFPPPGNLPDPGIEPTSPPSPVLAGRLFTSEPHGKPNLYMRHLLIKKYKIYREVENKNWKKIYNKNSEYMYCEYLIPSVENHLKL